MAEDWGTAVLELRADGTLVEEAVLKAGGKRSVQGTWEYDGRDLIRKPCLDITYLGVGEKIAGYCNQEAMDYALGRTEIILDPDRGISYRK